MQRLGGFWSVCQLPLHDVLIQTDRQDPLNLLPLLVPSADATAPDLIQVIAREGNSKETILFVQEGLERLERIVRDGNESNEKSVVQLIRLLDICRECEQCISGILDMYE